MQLEKGQSLGPAFAIHPLLSARVSDDKNYKIPSVAVRR